MESSGDESVSCESEYCSSEATECDEVSEQECSNEEDYEEVHDSQNKASKPAARPQKAGNGRKIESSTNERRKVINHNDQEEEEEEEREEERRKAQRQANIDALQNNSLETCRKPLMPKILSVQEALAQLKKPFKSPKEGAPRLSQDLRRRLAARRKVVPWGRGRSRFVPPKTPALAPLQSVPESQEKPPVEEEDGIEPLVLWTPDPSLGEEGESVEVDKRLTKFLRSHQREGVAFMFECIAGLKDYDGKGCILADDMGLGKTLQGISLMWTVLKQGAACLGGTPMVKRTIIVCPTSLVSNWESECEKWLQGSVRSLAMSESSREEVLQGIELFLHERNPYDVLILSYETFRIHSGKFDKPDSCDLLICDEAHRLKNDSTLTNKALDRLHCKRRVLLSGTPLQNHLEEFYAMVNFCNPGILGSPSSFRRTFEAPILAGREPDASEEEIALGQERSEELSGIVNMFILRRTNKLLSAHLPPKVVQVVCCRLTPIQDSLYRHFLQSTAAKRLLKDGKAGKSAGVLSAITSLKKLCNHPKLIYDAMSSKRSVGKENEGFEGCEALFPHEIFRKNRGGLPYGWEEMSGKMAVLARMMAILKSETTDRIVVVSNYTQTLDLVGALCREKNYPFLRLDGSTSISKRQKLVVKFNDLKDSQFAFLLSSKAGGCGLNLVGGNRLVLFDPDWNPANDKQAAARVWRDGQKKRVYVYRFLSTGTIEEKVFQRQLSKEGLQGVVNQSGQAGASLMSSEELRNLFSLDSQTLSDTYDSMCNNADEEVIDLQDSDHQENPGTIARQQIGHPGEDDLVNWGRHSSMVTVPDEVMHKAAGDTVSFVFTCEVKGKPIGQEDTKPPPMPDVINRNDQNRDMSDSNQAKHVTAEPRSCTGQQPHITTASKSSSSIQRKRRAVTSSPESQIPLQSSNENGRKQPRLSPKDISNQLVIEVLDSEDDGV